MASKTQRQAARRPSPRARRLYEVLKGIDFERRELVDKRSGVGLFDLVREQDGGYRCYACTLCERTCPVDCIEIDYCPEFAELPFDRAAERAAAWRPAAARAAGPARPASWARSRPASCPRST